MKDKIIKKVKSLPDSKKKKAILKDIEDKKNKTINK
jgi:hypothetical protein